MTQPTLVPSKPPNEVVLTRAQAKLFAIKDDSALDRYRVVRAGDALIQYNYDPNGDAEPKVIVHEPARTRTVECDSSHDFRVLIPSPSGKRFIILSDKGGDGWPAIPGGHAVEVERAGLRTQVAITGTTGRTGGFRDASAFDDSLPRLHAVDYAGDDDTLVAAMGTRTGALVLLRRDGASGRFEEVSRIKVLASENQLAASGRIVATSGDKKVTIYRVDGDRLVKVSAISKPSKYGVVFAHPSDTRQELYLRDGDRAYRLSNLDALLGTLSEPAANKPAAKMSSAEKKSTAKKSTKPAKKPATKKPATKKPATKKPAKRARS